MMKRQTFYVVDLTEILYFRFVKSTFEFLRFYNWFIPFLAQYVRNFSFTAFLIFRVQTINCYSERLYFVYVCMYILYTFFKIGQLIEEKWVPLFWWSATMKTCFYRLFLRQCNVLLFTVTRNDPGTSLLISSAVSVNVGSGLRRTGLLQLFYEHIIVVCIYKCVLLLMYKTFTFLKHTVCWSKTFDIKHAHFFVCLLFVIYTIKCLLNINKILLKFRVNLDHAPDFFLI
jgi:hypothetical protein